MRDPGPRSRRGAKPQRSTTIAQVAGPLLGAGATALYFARNSFGKTGEGDGETERLATDASFVELIESVSAATAQSQTIDEAMFACLGRICQWTSWPVGHVYL